MFALTGLVKNSNIPNSLVKIVSLLPADAKAIMIARGAGIDVISAPIWNSLRELLANADIVQVHFWNSPALYSFLRQGIGDCRLTIWCHVNGCYAPHVIPLALFQQAHSVLATTSITLSLPRHREFRKEHPDRFFSIPGGADFSRLDGYKAKVHDGFNIGYVGRVDPSKIHPEFVEICSRLQIPSARYVVRGDGDYKLNLSQKANEMGIQEKFSFQSHMDDIKEALHDLDVFGYPLHPYNSCTSELVVQEAMFAGIPPVLMSDGGAAKLVKNGKNGIVVSNSKDYVLAIQFLANHPTFRVQLGQQASLDARSKFGAVRTAALMDMHYEKLLQSPKRNIGPLSVTKLTEDQSLSDFGAHSFIESLDGVDDQNFLISLKESGINKSIYKAEELIGSSSPAMQDVILQYRMFYPLDRYLRLWSGLVFASRKRWALAAGELRSASKMGCGDRIEGLINNLMIRMRANG